MILRLKISCFIIRFKNITGYKEMSKAKLKKTLLSMPAEGIVEMVCELYDARKEAKEYLEYWLDPDPEAALEKYREEARKLFFLPSGVARKAPSATELRRLQKNFSSLCYDVEKELDLALYVAEQEALWIIGREGKANARIAPHLKRLDSLREEIEIAGLEDRFGLRHAKAVELAKDLEQNPPEKRRRRWRRWGW